MDTNARTGHMPKVIAIVVGVLAWGIVSGDAAAQTRGQHAVCGAIQGYTAEDLRHIRQFCDQAMTEEMAAVTVSVNARESLLFVNVTRDLADLLRADRLTTDVILDLWLDTWRAITDRRAVTVTVAWQGADVVVGDTTILGENRVRIR